MVKAFIFDIGNVVWNFQIPCGRVHQQFAGVMGVPIEKYNQLYLQHYQDFETSKADIFNLISKHNPSFTRDQLTSILESSLTVDTLNQYLNQDIITLLKLLRPRFKLGLLSNIEHFFYPYVNARLEKYFDFAVSSCQVGLRKPDPQIYEKALEIYHLLPGEVVFIDDKPENIAAACSLGLRGILFESSNKLLSELQKLSL